MPTVSKAWKQVHVSSHHEAVPNKVIHAELRLNDIQVFLGTMTFTNTAGPNAQYRLKDNSVVLVPSAQTISQAVKNKLL